MERHDTAPAAPNTKVLDLYDRLCEATRLEYNVLADMRVVSDIFGAPYAPTDEEYYRVCENLVTRGKAIRLEGLPFAAYIPTPPSFEPEGEAEVIPFPGV